MNDTLEFQLYFDELIPPHSVRQEEPQQLYSEALLHDETITDCGYDSNTTCWD